MIGLFSLATTRKQVVGEEGGASSSMKVSILSKVGGEVT